MAVDRRFEDQLIARIAQLGPPRKMRLNRFSHRYDCIDENADLIKVQARCEPMLGKPARCLVFERKRDVRNQDYVPPPRRHQ